MKHIKIFLLSLASSISALGADITVSPGQLEGLLEGVKNQTELRLRGSIDARDLAALENLSTGIKSLDLSSVTINGLIMPTRKYFGKTLFKEGEIPPYTFFKANTSTILLPANMTIVGEGAFAGAEITEITIPSGVTTIEDYAFYGCPNLKKINLPSTLTYIGKGAFGNCLALETVDLSESSITEIPDRAFAGAVMLEAVKLPAGVKKVGREAFSHTRINSLNLSNVSEFEAYALSSMPFLTSLSINPDAEIGDGLLMDDISLASLTGMPEFVPDFFAANCSEYEVSGMKNASTLGKYSFANTKTPEALVIGSRLSKIDRGALSGLSGITKIDVVALEGNLPSVDEFSFEGITPADIILLVNDDFINLWKSDPIWGTFQVQPGGLTRIEEIESDDNKGINIAYRQGIITVDSASAISDIRIFTAEGRTAYVASPATVHAEIETDNLPAGILVVTATDEDGNTTTLSLYMK